MRSDLPQLRVFPTNDGWFAIALVPPRGPWVWHRYSYKTRDRAEQRIDGFFRDGVWAGLS